MNLIFHNTLETMKILTHSEVIKLNYDDKPITIQMKDKPNLKALRFNNPPVFKEVLSACIALAEKAAENEDRTRIPWWELPQRFSPELNFTNMLHAVAESVFDAKQINPDSFNILEEDVHALAVFKSERERNGTYPDWRSHFDIPASEGNAGPDEVKQVLRKLLYYARFVDVEKFGKAVLSNHLSVHQALPELNAERLPFTPALCFQQEKFGDLKVGKFWDEIGAFYGGTVDTLPETCPACGHTELKQVGDFYVCPSCNLGVVVNEDSSAV